MADDPIETQPSPELEAEAVRGSLTGAVAAKAGDQSAPEPVDTGWTPDVPDSAQTLDSLLAEFEAFKQPEAQAKPEAPPAPANPPYDFNRDLADFEKDQKLRLAEMKAEDLTTEVQQARTWIDETHFKAVTDAIDKRLSDFGLPVPEGYARDKVLAAAFQSPDLVKAFDNRGQDPRAYNRAMRKLQDKIVADAKSMPDKYANEDRAAVVHAMRGASTKMPAERPPDYGSMSPGDFQKELEKHGIYR